jgi:hypothetical protein
MKKTLLTVIFSLFLCVIAHADVLVQLAWELDVADYKSSNLAPNEVYKTIVVKRRVWPGDMTGTDEFLSDQDISVKTRSHAILDASQDGRLACFRVHIVKRNTVTNLITAWSQPATLASNPSGYWTCKDPSPTLPSPREFAIP